MFWYYEEYTGHDMEDIEDSWLSKEDSEEEFFCAKQKASNPPTLDDLGMSFRDFM